MCIRDRFKQVPEGYINFAFDGLEDTNHLYRRRVNWSTAIKNATAYIDSGGTARWTYLTFKHNEHQIEEARSLAKKMNFLSFEIKRALGFSYADDFPVYSRTGKFEYYLEFVSWLL